MEKINKLGKKRVNVEKNPSIGGKNVNNNLGNGGANKPDISKINKLKIGKINKSSIDKVDKSCIDKINIEKNSNTGGVAKLGISKINKSSLIWADIEINPSKGGIDRKKNLGIDIAKKSGKSIGDAKKAKKQVVKK